MTKASIDSPADASTSTRPFSPLPLPACSGNIRPNSEVAATAGAYTYCLSQNSSTTLDLIRAISAQLVLIGHGLYFCDVAKRFASLIQDLGVLMFFLLSGLLITYSTFRKKNRGDYRFKTFFIERASRIYSGYLPSICVIVCLDILFIHAYGQNEYHYVLSFRAFIGNIFMLQDFPHLGIIGITSLGSARPLWTLAVEWWFYMFFGFVVLIKSFESRRGLYVALLTALAVVPFSNSVVAGRGNGLFVVWMMGFLVAVVLNGPPTTISPRRCQISAAVCFVSGLLRAYNAGTAYDLILAACLAGSLFFMVRGLDQARGTYSPAIRRAITFMADYSFSLYLIHYSILVLLVPLTVSISPYLLLGGGLVGANVIAAMLAIPTEMRHRQLAKRLIRVFS